jgi:hypothetical protein
LSVTNGQRWLHATRLKPAGQPDVGQLLLLR